MGNAPEVVREVGIHDVRMATEQQLLHGAPLLERHWEPEYSHG